MIQFSKAMLRMGDEYSIDEKMSRVEELLTTVSLQLVQINKNKFIDKI